MAEFLYTVKAAASFLNILSAQIIDDFQTSRQTWWGSLFNKADTDDLDLTNGLFHECAGQSEARESECAFSQDPWVG